MLICDRDAKWSEPVRARLQDAGIHVVQTPYRAPNANAYAERFVRSIKGECLARLIPFGERHFRRAVAEFVAHYHRERNHQGLNNELIEGPPAQNVAGAYIGANGSVDYSTTTPGRRSHWASGFGGDAGQYGVPMSRVGSLADPPPGGVSAMNQRYAASAPIVPLPQRGSPGGAAALQEGTIAYPSVYPFQVLAVSPRTSSASKEVARDPKDRSERRATLGQSHSRRMVRE
jgi:Integrase core domain